MSAHGGGYIKWNAEEWLRVAVNMLPLLDAGKTKYVALANAQRKVLPKNRQQHDQWIAHTTQPARKFIDTKLQLARDLPEEQRALFRPVAAATSEVAEEKGALRADRKMARRGSDEGRVYAGAKWTEREWALIARMVKWFKVNGAQQVLSRLVIEAQELVLPADRRRSLPGIQASVAGGRLEKNMAKGTANIFLVTDVPFNPPLPPGAEQPQQATEMAQIRDEIAGVQLTPPPPPNSPAISPVSVAPGPTETTARESTSAAPAPGGISTIREAMTAASLAFAATMQHALDTLLQTNTTLVMREMQARIEANSQAMAAQVAGMVESGMRKAVHRMMEQELGGSVAPPTDSPGASLLNDGPRRHDPSPIPSERRQALAVDVIGFEIGHQQTTVRDAFAGEVDIRFVHPDTSNYTPMPNRHAIIMQGRCPHAMTEKLKKHRIQPIAVQRTPGHVIHAIEELQRAQQAAVAH